MIAGIRKSHLTTIRSQSAAVLVTALLFLLISALILSQNMRQSLWQLRLADNITMQLQRRYIAEKTMAQLIRQIEQGVQPPCWQALNLNSRFIGKNKPFWQQAAFCFHPGDLLDVAYVVEQHPDRYAKQYLRITVAVFNHHNSASTVRQGSYTVLRNANGVKCLRESWHPILEG